MKRAVFLLSFAIVLFATTSFTFAQILFHADFENNSGVNDPAKWEKNNVTPGAHLYKLEGGWLTQTADGCDKSTKTLLPADGANWGDYTLAVDMRFRGDIGDSNDVISIIFRYTAPDAYYNFSIGASQYNFQWWLVDTHANEAVCFDGPLPPANQTLAMGDHGVQIDDAKGKEAYTAVVKVTGNKIEAFFGKQVDVLAGNLPPKVGEAEDNKHKKGTVGIHMASVPASFDNIIVGGPAGFSVDPKDKLATSWGRIKVNY